MTWFQLLLLVAMVAIFWLLIIRPTRVRREAQQRLIASLTPGMRVMTAAGVFGTVVEATAQRVRLEVAPGVVLEMLPLAIAESAEGPREATPGPLELRAPAGGPAASPGEDPTGTDPAGPPTEPLEQSPTGELPSSRSDGSSPTAPEADRG